MNNSKFNYEFHDASVSNIIFDIENRNIRLTTTLANGQSKILTFSDFKYFEFKNGDVRDLFYIFHVEIISPEKYLIQFSGAPTLEIHCKELSIE